MSHTTTQPGICRICSAHCGVLATVTDGRLTKVTGDPDNPMFKGYTCVKGRTLPEIHNNPLRLLHSQKRLQQLLVMLSKLAFSTPLLAQMLVGLAILTSNPTS